MPHKNRKKHQNWPTAQQRQRLSIFSTKIALISSSLLHLLPKVVKSSKTRLQAPLHSLLHHLLVSSLKKSPHLCLTKREKGLATNPLYQSSLCLMASPTKKMFMIASPTTTDGLVENRSISVYPFSSEIPTDMLFFHLGAPHLLKKMLEDESKTKIFCVFHKVDHFTFGIFDKASASFFYYDSLYSKGEVKGKRMFQFALDLFPKGKVQNIQYIYGTQKDTINCGVFCISYLERFLLNKPIPSHHNKSFLNGELCNTPADPIDAGEVRVRFCNMIHQEVHLHAVGRCVLCSTNPQANNDKSDSVNSVSA